MAAFITRDDTIDSYTVVETVAGVPEGYNIGDLLNMPYMVDSWPKCHRAIKTMNNVGAIMPCSIVGKYCSQRAPADDVPDASLLRGIVVALSETLLSKEIRDLVSSPSTLVVHMRAGDLWQYVSRDDFINSICAKGVEFENVLLCTGVHADAQHRPVDDSRRETLRLVKTVLDRLPNALAFCGSADDTLALASCASNILVHRGGFSCLMSLVSSSASNVLYTKSFVSPQKEHWRCRMVATYTAI